ncbi:MAG TPA: alpha/beta hydrolase [Smithellaceae bacterium]|nr:alpha/beta hydrolase [Smithellaceae bacterium]HRS96758.1 alpha/beta hydrolase [Smithella sp.]
MSSFRDQHLVFMPGMDGTGLSFEPVLPHLPESATITIVRYPADKLLSFDETVECAAEQILAGDPPIVIAESFSGPVAIKMIGSGRVKAKALILCATFAKSPRPIVWRFMRFLRLPMLIKPEMPKRFFKVVIGNDKLIDELKPLWKKVHARVPARVMQHRLKIINEIDVTAWLSKIKIPCCYLQATNDRLVPASCAEKIKKIALFVEIKKISAPHFILQAEPQACLNAIEDFCSK